MQARIRVRATISRLLIIGAVALSSPLSSSGSKPESASDARSEIVRLIDDLGDDDFEVRQKGATRLAELASQAKPPEYLGPLVRAALDQVDTPYEARRLLDDLARLLPQIKPEIPVDVADVEIDQLIGMLDGETYVQRIGAAARLSALAERPSLACRIVERLRPLRRNVTLSRQTRQRLEPIWDKAQLAWLSSDPKTWEFPPVDQQRIDDLLYLLVRPLPPPSADESRQETRARLERKRRVSQRDSAQGDLLALLIREDQTARVKAAVDERLAGGQIDDDARQRLSTLADWMRPWLAIELWTEGKVTSILELPLGVPYERPMAPRPTLFDRCDGHVAHCVSDPVLAPPARGPRDYPLGVFFPHPSVLRSDSQFVIFDLPTPRSRMAYHYRLKSQRDQRLPELSERTLARLAAEKRPLKQAELLMLPSLDAHAVSRFATKYLLAVGDPSAPDKQQEERAGRGSPYESFCNMLVEIGTHEAVPGILAAIKAGMLKEPTASSNKPQGDWRWVAALAILASDPPADTDGILPDLISRTDPLVINGESPCDVGATAAAILVDLHHLDVEKFGLEQADEPLLAEFGGIGYRFNPPEMRQKVLEWWASQRRKTAEK